MLRRIFFYSLVLAFSTCAMARDDKDASNGKMSPTERREILRTFTAEPVFIHRVFPMGRDGVRIENGRISPTDAEARQMAAQYGVAAKPGDRAKITDVHFLSKAIVFEINGGP